MGDKVSVGSDFFNFQLREKEHIDKSDTQSLEVKITIESHEFKLLILCLPHRTHVSRSR